MKIRKVKRYDRREIVKDTLIEFLFEVFWKILMFIPRILFRLIKNLFN